MRSLLIASTLAVTSVACSDVDQPRQHLPAVSADRANFLLWVSNQSFDIDPVDIEVRLDGQLAVTGEFLVEGQHSWHEFAFRLAPGNHTLSAASRAGGANVSQMIDTTFPTYGALDFWYYAPGSVEEYGVEPTRPQFSFYLSDEPPQFE
jgi:hypothetical protein